MNANNYSITNSYLLRRSGWTIIIILVTFLISVTSFSQEKKYTTYRVTDNETIISIAKKIGITPHDLFKLNPDARNGIDIDEVIIIPNKKFKGNIVVNKPKLPQPKPVISYKDSIKNGVLYHRVKKDETIYSLCRKYKVKKKKILKLNRLKKRSKISLGQLLKFPTKKPDTYPKIPVKIVEVIQQSNAIDGFKTYTVKAQDTKYTLAKNHNISVDELEKINPHLKDKTLNEYDVIKLPVTITKSIEVASIYKTHKVLSQETFFKITRLYKVTKEDLIDLNPVLEEGLKEGMLIKIPNKSNNFVEDLVIKTHLVQKKETIFSLTKKYEVTEKELLDANPELQEGLKEGMTIKIPTKIIKIEKLLNLDDNFSGKKLEVVLMLPFKAKEKMNTPLSESRGLNKIIDFYLGSVVAVEDLKKKGLSINLKVLDTKGKGNKVAISNLVNSNGFKNTDVIIGPMHYSNVEQISKMLNNTPIVSPIAIDDHSVLENVSIIQNNASKKHIQNKMLDFIKERYTNQNLIIITDETKQSSLKTKEIINYLKLHDSIKKITVLNVEKGYIEREKFEKAINIKEENWVILASEQKETSNIAADNLGFLSEEFKVTLFGLNIWKNFEGIKNVYLNRLNFHYPSTNFIDKTNVAVIDFNNKYKSKYNVYPSSFVYKGYDTTYDALIRIATYNNLNDSFQLGKTKGLVNSFNYKKTNTSNYYNGNIFIVKYKDYEIVIAE